MTTLNLNTALANFHPTSALASEAGQELTRHLLSPALRRRFASYKGLLHEDVVQEVLVSLWKRAAPVLAHSADAYLHKTLANAYNSAAASAARRSKREVLHTADVRALQEREERAQAHTFTSRGHALAELTEAMPTLARDMFGVDIDAVMLEHFVRVIIPLLSRRTQTEGAKFANERVEICTGQRSVPNILEANLDGAPSTPEHLQRARNAFNKKAERYRGYFQSVFAREDLARVTGLLEEEATFLEEWARAMAIL